MTRKQALPVLLLTTGLSLILPCCRATGNRSPAVRYRPIVSVRPDERLFATLCAAQVAGKGRRERFEDLSKLAPSVTKDVKGYIQSHGFSEVDFSIYALLLSAPPELTKRYSAIDPIPPVRISMGDFAPVLRKFYGEADIHSLWLKYLPRYEGEAKRYRGKADDYIARVFEFLREAPPEAEGQIVLIPNLLQRKGSGCGVLLDGVSYLIVGASTSREVIQHEFLHTVVNPLTRHHLALVYRAKALHPLARARTPFYYRSWETIVNETLIRTMVAMIANRGAGKREKAVRKLIDQGYLLASHFLDKLMEYENGSLTFREFYPQLFRQEELDRAVRRILVRWKPPFAEPGKLKGPINDVVSRRYKAIRVYGTRGSRQETEEILKAIELNDAAYFNRLAAVKADTAVTGEDISASNLILYGTVEGNALIRSIAPRLPVAISMHAITVGGRRYTDPRVKLIMACPNPLNPDRYVVLYTGLSWQTVIDAHSIFHGPSDYVVSRGLERLEEGFFDKKDSRRWNPPKKHSTFPRDENWKVRCSEHYAFHFRPNSVAEKEIDFVASVQEAAYRRIVDLLGEATGPVIGYYLYEPLADKARVTGHSGSGVAEAALAEVHSVYSEERRVTGTHEDCHVLAQQLWGGTRLPFLLEGLAVYCDGHWLSAPLDHWVAVLSRRGDLIPPQDLLQPDVFEGYPDLLTYPVAGSFVGFLVQEFGMESFKTFYLSAHPGRFREEFEMIYPLSLEEAESLWLSRCRAVGDRLPFLGFVAADVRGELVVTRVYDGSPSDRVGLEVRDVLKMIGPDPVRSLDDLKKALARMEPGEELTLTVRRGAESVEFRMRPEALEGYLEKL